MKLAFTLHGENYFEGTDCLCCGAPIEGLEDKCLYCYEPLRVVTPEKQCQFLDKYKGLYNPWGSSYLYPELNVRLVND